MLVALAALGATIVAFVLVPVFTEERSRRKLTTSDAERELIDLEEKKSRLYENLADLDFEKASGKVSETDYERARNDYLAQVGQVIARLDAIAPEVKASVAARAAEPTGETRRCASCGGASPMTAKFCVDCGRALEPGCPSCGAELPANARFCPACGTKTSE